MAAAKKSKYKFKNGDKVKIVSNASGTNLPIGTVLTILGPQGNGYYRTQEYPQWNFPVGDLELVPCTFTKESVDKEIAGLQAQIDALNAKLAFLDETGQEEGCEREFKVYQTLSLVEDGNLTKQQKAKAIASLLETD
jgi:hypothetical protein